MMFLLKIKEKVKISNVKIQKLFNKLNKVFTLEKVTGLFHFKLFLAAKDCIFLKLISKKGFI